MSLFFSHCAQCDPSIVKTSEAAATLLVNRPSYDATNFSTMDDPSLEPVTIPAPAEDGVLTVATAGDPRSLHTKISQLRARLDGPAAADLRVSLAREANLQKRELEHTKKLAERMEQIEKRNTDLLKDIKKEEERLLEEERRRIQQDYSPTKSEAVGAPHEVVPKKDDVFLRFRIEETRMQLLAARQCGSTGGGCVEDDDSDSDTPAPASAKPSEHKGSLPQKQLQKLKKLGKYTQKGPISGGSIIALYNENAVRNAAGPFLSEAADKMLMDGEEKLPLKKEPLLVLPKLDGTTLKDEELALLVSKKSSKQNQLQLANTENPSDETINISAISVVESTKKKKGKHQHALPSSHTTRQATAAALAKVPDVPGAIRANAPQLWEEGKGSSQTSKIMSRLNDNQSSVERAIAELKKLEESELTEQEKRRQYRDIERQHLLVEMAQQRGRLAQQKQLLADAKARLELTVGNQKSDKPVVRPIASMHRLPERETEAERWIKQQTPNVGDTYFPEADSSISGTVSVRQDGSLMHYTSEHPIDAYRREVRWDLLRDRNEKNLEATSAASKAIRHNEFS